MLYPRRWYRDCESLNYVIIYIMESIEALKTYLTNRLPGADIYLFGSRATGRETSYSDVDIAIKSSDLDPKDLAWIRLVIEESNFPYKVDLIDLSKAPYLAEIIEKEGIQWQ